MRHLRSITLALVTGAVAVAGCGPYHGGYAVSAEMGPGVDLYGYYPDYWGDWRTNYSLWSPTVVYEYGGRYYPTRVRNGRPVSVYQYRNQYFLPPRDGKIGQTDHRIDMRHRPSNQDYQRARPRPDGRGPGAP
ncbi:MAG: hypothetical protein ACREK8_11575 [Gemmatimonadales bacterium]